MSDKIRLLIATHTYGTVLPAYAVSLARATARLGRLGVAHEVLMIEDSLVDRGRDRAAYEMLTGDFTHLMFIDGDVEFDQDAILALLQCGKPVIGGALPMRGSETDFILVPLDGPVEQCPDSKAVKVARIGAGFLLIQREVFVRLAEARPEASYTETDPSGSRQTHAYFEHVVRNGTRLSEDYSFCERWRELGGEIWLYPYLTFGHWGLTRWRGSVISKFKRA